MKRRDFLAAFSLGALAVAALSKASGLMNKAMAQAVVMVAAGKLGYKPVAPEAQVKAGKQCSTCKHFGEANKEGIGPCNLPAMKTAMKAASAPSVIKTGYCNMWAAIPKKA
jgi:hypothetical protein